MDYNEPDCVQVEDPGGGEYEYVGDAEPDPKERGPAAHGDRAPDRVRERGGDGERQPRGGTEPGVIHLNLQFKRGLRTI